MYNVFCGISFCLRSTLINKQNDKKIKIVLYMLREGMAHYSEHTLPLIGKKVIVSLKITVYLSISDTK